MLYWVMPSTLRETVFLEPLFNPNYVVHGCYHETKLSRHVCLLSVALCSNNMGSSFSLKNVQSTTNLILTIPSK